ncbi:MAG: LytR/AlgR family response regulator transcription factor [Leptothrix sp. (in: b-proteobacteria)]
MSYRPTALIAEDEPLLAAGLQSDLQQLWPELQVVAKATNGKQALALGLAHQPDICFLDIRMPGLSGLEVAQALAEDWPDDAMRTFPLLVFVTAYDQYAVQAFEHQALDYLLKPVEPQRLAICVRRLQAQLAQRVTSTAATATADRTSLSPVAQSRALEASAEQLRALLGHLAAATHPSAHSTPRLEVIQAQIGHTVHLIPIDEVLYFEAADKYVRAITAEREHLLRLSLRELLPQLDEQRFWQIHRGSVVQVRAINTAVRDEAGKVFLSLHNRPERLSVSRLYAYRFKGM